MFCTQCGQKNVEDANFCEACGAPLTSASGSQRPTPPPSISPQQGSAPSESKRRAFLIVGAATIVLLMAVGGAWWGLSRAPQGTRTNAEALRMPTPKLEGKWSNGKLGRDRMEVEIQKVGNAYFFDEKYRGRTVLKANQDGTVEAGNYGTWIFDPKSDTFLTDFGVLHRVHSATNPNLTSSSVTGVDLKNAKRPADKSGAHGERSELTPAAARISPNGVGPLRFGMTVKEASNLLGRKMDVEQTPHGCPGGYFTGPDGDSLWMTVAQNRIVGIATQDARWITDAGIRVGDSEEKLRTAYTGQLQERRAGGLKQLIFAVKSEGEKEFRITYFLDNQRRVGRLEAGLLPWIDGRGKC